MKTYLLKVNDDVKGEALAGFLQDLNFVEELKPISHWQDDDFDEEALEADVKSNMLRKKNAAIAKHISNED